MEHTENTIELGQLITAKVICDSVAETGNRITTFELEYPRMVHCFHPKTEFLSQINDEFPQWRNYDAIVALSAKVAQYEDGVLSFVYPDGAIKKPASKLVIHKRKTFEFAVTPEHRMYSQRRTTNNVFLPHVDMAKDWLGEYPAHRRIPQAGSLMNSLRRNTLSEAEYALIAYYVADGHKPKDRELVGFHFSKQRKITHVCSLLDSLEIDYTCRTYEDDTVIEFLPPSWVEDCYTDDGDKKYPNIIWDMPKSCYQAFKLAVLLSDGCLENREINTTSAFAANQLQILAALNEDAMNIRAYKGGLYKQKFQKTNYVSFRSDKDRCELVEYTGDVVCFSVPSSFLFVRYNGFAFISGNCELLTHRVFSKNASSSRAIPIAKVIEQVRNSPAMPVKWGKNRPGMQAKEELVGLDRVIVKQLWNSAADSACVFAENMDSRGAHKQVVNRILEPFQRMKTVLTATEFENFFWLRNHSDADPTLEELAKQMHRARELSVPTVLAEGEYHLPYIRLYRDCFSGDLHYYDMEGQEHSLEDAIKVSISCCAQVSYRKLDGSLIKAEDIIEKLFGGADDPENRCHSSPSEHIASPIKDYGCDLKAKLDALFTVPGITHIDKDQNLWSGNLKGWIQHRQLITNNVKKG